MYFNSKGLSIYYEKYGDKKETMLILPGWGNTRNTFNNIINFFKNNYTIYIIDYPGFGNSKIPKIELTIYDYTELIIAFMSKLKIKDPIIIAHSFGGRIANLLSSKYKIPINKMILIDIAGIKPQKTLKQYLKTKLYKLLKKITSHLKNKEKYHKKLLNIFASDDYKEVPKEMRNTFKNIVNEDLLPYFKNITSECLLIWGKLDDATPLSDGQKINNLIKDSALIVYPKSRHFSYLEYPYLTNQIIHEFIKVKD